MEIEPVTTRETLLSVFQWNILADSLATNFSNVPDEDLKFENRVKLFKEAFSQFKMTDIFTLQELDRAEEIMEIINSLSEDEYLIEHIAKFGAHPDGPCVIYNSKALELIHVKKDRYRSIFEDGQAEGKISNRVYVICVFRHKESGKVIQ